jgi:Na+/H+-translocating membrane pyrophosphatase
MGNQEFPRSASTLAVRVGDKIGALKGLAMRLREISQYLSQVVAGKLPMNQEGHRYTSPLLLGKMLGTQKFTKMKNIPLLMMLMVVFSMLFLLRKAEVSTCSKGSH